MLKAITEQIWTVDQDLKLLGAHLGTRMMVVRLSHQSLLLYSPVRINEALAQELQTLGTVKYLVGPNPFHHLYLGSAQRAFPQARTWLVPSLAKKRKDLAEQPQSEVLQDPGQTPWQAELPGLLIKGSDSFEELVLYDPRSKTLLSTDLILNYTPHYRRYSLFEKGFFRLLGVYNHKGPSLIQKVMFKKSARHQLEQLLGWDFERILVTHGENIEQFAKARLQQTYQFLLC